ncbi:MAG: ribonuclease III [Nitrospirae bacterium]|nr:ribonuclease III [Candidatus Troglogloeales bacterium]MBI3597873.1 ribonuclease III [Candidatus Troglogloeales bacterium]
MPDLSSLQERMGIVFKNPGLLLQALTHKSYSNENPKLASGNNERLEFLGDTVLSLIISHTLFIRNPDLSEGDLSKMRAHVVSGPALAGVARKIGLGPFLLLGAGEEKSAGREKTSILSDALEAVIAAIYLDKGIVAAKKFVLMACADLLNPISLGRPADHKTALQEFCQEGAISLPTYHVVNAYGPDHQKRYEIEVKILDIPYGMGIGKSKKEAEQQSAKTALARLRE